MDASQRNERISKLQAPTPKDAISYKPQGKPIESKHGPGYVCRALAYIDARFVMQRLDEAIGPEGWATDVKNVGGLVAVGIGIRDDTLPGDNQWVWKWDTGMEGNPFRQRSAEDDEKKSGDRRDDIAFKGLISNGLKRAAVQWGIGRDIYDLKTGWRPCEVYTDKGAVKWKAWLPEGKPAQTNGATHKAGPGTFEYVGARQDAMRKILKVLQERGGMTQEAAMAWFKAETAKADDGTIECLRTIYAKAMEETGV